MESAFYGYFYLKTENLSITWDTFMIENFVEQIGSYIREKSVYT